MSYDPEYHKQYYKRNKEKYKERAKINAARSKERILKIIREAKDVPCADCGERYPFYVMQFDHIGDKEFTIAHYSYTASPDRLRIEIAKCEVVCANCHAVRTYQRSHPTS